MNTLLLLIPALPLAGAILVAALGRWLGARSHLPIVGALALSFVCSLLLLLDVRASKAPTGAVAYEHIFTVWTWADVEDAYSLDEPADDKSTSAAAGPFDFDIGVTLRADTLTCLMLSMVTFVSMLVAIYAAGYMHGDPGYWRFFAYIGLFVFSMTMLVSVSNFVLLYVFWEAVGVCSYLLIGFWYQKPEAAAAGKKAFLVNRVGDFGFALALFLIWSTYGTLNFHDTFAAADNGETIVTAGIFGQTRLADPLLYAGGGVALAICLLLMLGACGKSAQFPLHVWLPDAMEGPTPVSALIHAATMVTAGVYMVVRCAPLFAAASGVPLFEIDGEPIDAGNVVSIIGGFTALLAGLIAITQTDLKRVLAYSTVSQLGYMFLSVGTGTLLGITAGMFHLFTHAFFKALLFLGAGSVMHAMGGVIDVRYFGGLKRLMPITRWTFLIGCLALSGIIPLAGFWSKDEILAALHERAHHADEAGHTVQAALHNGLYWLALFAALLTAFYTFRAYFMTFHGAEQIPREAGHHAHESPASMTIPLIILAICSVVVGLLFGPTHLFGDFLGRAGSLAFEPIASTRVEPVFHTDIAVISTLAAFLGIGLAAFMYLGERREAETLAGALGPLYRLSRGKFFFDELYNVILVWPLRVIAVLSYVVDRFFVDGLVNLCGKLPAVAGYLLRSLQNGMVQWYALAMVLGLVALFWQIVMRPA
ncbi:MAG: NADH-quinone oxidoreductase subunit L [Pirellulales bacterium]